MTHAKWPWKTLQFSGSQKSIFCFFFFIFFKERPLELSHSGFYFIFFFSIKDCLQKHVQKWLHLKRQALLTQSPKSIRPKVLPKTNSQTFPGTGQNWPLDCFSVHLKTRQDGFYSLSSLVFNWQDPQIPIKIAAFSSQIDTRRHW